jgi:thiol-disulfide isomerase/thioredoxin
MAETGVIHDLKVKFNALSDGEVIGLIVIVAILVYVFLFDYLPMEIKTWFSSKFEDIKSTFEDISFFGASKPEMKYQELPSEDSVLIIYAPWCGHCKSSMPEFQKAAEHPAVKLIDATDPANAEILSKYPVKGYPSIINAVGVPYSGERKASDIIAFANEKKVA